MTKLTSEKRAAQISYWVTGAHDDLAAATEIIQKTSRFAAGLFFLHLAIEKILKARFVQNNETYAPITHNLLSLAAKAGLEPTPEQEAALAGINEFNLETRYPSEKDNLQKIATKAFATAALDSAKELFQWISQHLDP